MGNFTGTHRHGLAKLLQGPSRLALEVRNHGSQQWRCCDVDLRIVSKVRTDIFESTVRPLISRHMSTVPRDSL